MKGLAIIVPLDEEEDDKVFSELKFIDKVNKHKIVRAYIPANVFRYHYYGATIEVVELDEQNNCLDIHDIKREDLCSYGLSMVYALTLNFVGNSVVALGTNGIVYYLEQSTFFRSYLYILANMYNGMRNASNFVFRFYLMEGEVVYAQLECNKKEDSIDYKYAIRPGFCITDRSVLKTMLPKTQEEFNDSNEKLNQSQIDKLIESLI